MRAYLLIISLAFMGCTLAQVQVDVLSERTALENQILGTYNAIDREMMLVASVRGVDPLGNIRTPPRRSQDHKDAIAAMQLLEFHKDDLQAFKRLGWVGENNRGLVEPLNQGQLPIPPDSTREELDQFAARYDRAEFSAVVSQINSARQTLMQRVIELNPNLTSADIPKVERIFGKLNAENALPGDHIQRETGDWIRIPVP